MKLNTDNFKNMLISSLEEKSFAESVIKLLCKDDLMFVNSNFIKSINKKISDMELIVNELLAVNVTDEYELKLNDFGDMDNSDDSLSNEQTEQLEAESQKVEKLEKMLSQNQLQLKNVQESLNAKNKKLTGKNSELSKQLKKCNSEKKEYTDKVNRLTKEIAAYRENFKSIENENRILKDNISKCNQKFDNLNTKFSDLQTKFKSIYRIYDMFNSLPSETIKVLRGIFKKECLESFIACGVQQSNLNSLWEYMKSEVMSNRFEHIQKLSEIHGYFFELLNQTDDEPRYRWQNVNVGECFDVEKYTRAKDGKAAGNISQIYLIGYESVITGKVIKKSIVKI